MGDLGTGAEIAGRSITTRWRWDDRGISAFNMVGSLEQLPVLKPHVSQLLANVEFVEGKRYTDFNSTTDKVAAVGLTALIAGAAVKSGLLAAVAFIIPCWWRERSYSCCWSSRSAGWPPNT